MTYLANEGVMLEGSAGRVFIDAFFRDGLPEYAVVPQGSRDSLERALEGYGGPAAVLTTHGHRDHYDSAAVARYLASNAGAVAVGPPELGQRGDVAPVDLGWVRILPLAIAHGPTRRPVGHTAYLVTLDGTTVLHLGDTQSDPATWTGLGLPARGVDVALVPYWYALSDSLFPRLLEVVQARTVVLLHVPVGHEESEYLKSRGGWAALSRGLRGRYPRVRIPVEPGEVVDLGARGGSRPRRGSRRRRHALRAPGRYGLRTPGWRTYVIYVKM